MKRGAVGFAPTALLFSATARPAAAIPITFGFTGRVTEVPVDDVGTGVDFGTPIEGRYTFESTAIDFIAGTSSASFQMAGIPYGMTVDVGGNLFATSDSLAVNLFDSFVEQYGVLACSADLSCSGELSISIFLQDDGGLALASDLLPLTPPDLTGFATRDFELLALLDGSELQIQGTIDTLVCLEGCGTGVPEPGTLALLGTGWGALSLFGRRRRSRRGRRRQIPLRGIEPNQGGEV